MKEIWGGSMWVYISQWDEAFTSLVLHGSIYQKAPQENKHYYFYDSLLSPSLSHQSVQCWHNEQTTAVVLEPGMAATHELFSHCHQQMLNPVATDLMLCPQDGTLHQRDQVPTRQLTTSDPFSPRDKSHILSPQEMCLRDGCASWA